MGSGKVAGEYGKRAGLWTMSTKIIYEVGDEWIFRPGFQRKEEELLQEHEETHPNPSPDLQEGDEIIVIDLGRRSYSKKLIPDTLVPYKVTGKHRSTDAPDTCIYYDIEPIDAEPYHSWGSPQYTHRRIYARDTCGTIGDGWIFRPGFKREEEEISEDGELRQGKSLTPDQSQLIRGFDKWKELKEHEEKVNPSNRCGRYHHCSGI